MKTYTQRELNEVLRLHELWLNSNGEEGARADLSGADLYRANLIEANLSRVNLSRVNLYGVNLSKANLSLANLSEADLYLADLSKANLSQADLSGADLYRANLYRANLYRSNLPEANLIEANLSEVNLSFIKGKIIHQFNGPRHQGYCFDGLITIGCICHPIEHWLMNYKDIGTENYYTKEEIEIYGKWIQDMNKTIKGD